MAEELDVAGLTLHPTSSRGEQANHVLDTSSGSGAASKPTAAAQPAGPIPMSMPSILRNTGTPSRVLNHSSSSSYPPTNPTRVRRKEPSLGRRKQRRSENLRLLTSSSTTTTSSRPTPKDYRLHSNAIKSTFTSAAAAASKSVPVPSSSKVGFSEPSFDAYSANQGYFGTSLRDAQRTLRSFKVDDAMISEGKAGELERFIWLVEREIRTWSCSDVFLFNTTTSNKTGRVLLDDQFNFPSTPREIELDGFKPAGKDGQVVEFQRTPNALVWLVQDPFLRLVVHCLSRVLKCPSFSKDDTTRPGLRFTWILNPNPMARKRGRRNRRVSVTSDTASTTPTPIPTAEVIGVDAGLDTPPTTDFDSQTESELDTDTDAGVESLAGSIVLVSPPGHEREEEGEGRVDTDEEEVEILRRVRRWAIDSGRQRKRDAEQVEEGSGEAQQGDPDRTLTVADVIDEEEEFDEDDDYGESDDGDDDEVRSLDDA